MRSFLSPSLHTDYYVYALLDPSRGHKPFYVGKGRGYRYSHHYTPAYVARHSHKSHIIQRYRSLGFADEHVFLACNLSEVEAFVKEVEWIKKYGLRIEGGLLVNASLGGEGSSGCNQAKTLEHRLKISAAHRGKVFKPETLAKMSAAKSGKAQSSEHRAKVSASLKGKTKSEAHRAALSAAAYRRYGKTPPERCNNA